MFNITQTYLDVHTHARTHTQTCIGSRYLVTTYNNYCCADDFCYSVLNRSVLARVHGTRLAGAMNSAHSSRQRDPDPTVRVRTHHSRYFWVPVPVVHSLYTRMEVLIDFGLVCTALSSYTLGRHQQQHHYAH